MIVPKDILCKNGRKTEVCPEISLNSQHVVFIICSIFWIFFWFRAVEHRKDNSGDAPFRFSNSVELYQNAVGYLQYRRLL